MRRATLIALCAFCLSALYNGFAQDAQVSSRKLLVKVQPQYPELAHAAHITGIAKLQARVNTNGRVESVEILGGHPLLAQAAVLAVRQWKWEPSSQASEETVVVKFSLPE
ncbi:MAG TPA: energy transducer TonB [Terriglobales bacterium]|nr:energy transducer TonB [Terriglobales bacterium]